MCGRVTRLVSSDSMTIEVLAWSSSEYLHDLRRVDMTIGLLAKTASVHHRRSIGMTKEVFTWSSKCWQDHRRSIWQDHRRNISMTNEVLATVDKCQVLMSGSMKWKEWLWIIKLAIKGIQHKNKNSSVENKRRAWDRRWKITSCKCKYLDPEGRLRDRHIILSQKNTIVISNSVVSNKYHQLAWKGWRKKTV